MAARAIFAALNDGSRIKTGSRKFGAGGSLFVPNATSGACLVLRNGETSPGSTWTVEAFCRITTFNANENVLFAPSSTGTSCVITLTSTAVKVYDQTNAAAKVLRLTASATLSTLTYYHVAVTYNGTTLDVYLDGVNIGTVNTTAANLTIASGGHFIGRGNTINSDSFFGNIDEFRFSSIRRYTGNFTPTTVPFTDDANTKWLFHFDNSDQATSVLDDDGTDLQTRTRYGGGFTIALTKTAAAGGGTQTGVVKYGSRAYSFFHLPGTGNGYVQLVPTYGSDLQGANASLQPFIVEFWIRLDRGNNQNHGIFGASSGGGGNNSFWFRNIDGNFYWDVAGTGVVLGTGTNATWIHICAEYKPGVGIAFYYNGSKLATVINPATNIFSIANWYLGALQGSESTYNGNGSILYIDDFRVTKGLQRYNHTSFSPPGSLVNDEYTVLLLKGEETTSFVDVVALPPQTHSGAATLSSAFTSTQAGRLTKLGAFNNTASFTLEAQSRKLVRGASLEFGTFTVNCQASIQHKANANLNAYFGYLFGNPKVTRNISATVNSAFTQTGAGRLLKLGQSSLTTTATLSVTPKVTHKATVQLSSAFTLSAQPEGGVFGLATLSSAFTQSATAKVTHKAALTLSGVFGLTAQGKRSVKGASLEFGAFTISATAKVTHKARANVTGSFTLTATAQAQPKGQATVTARFGLTSTSKVTHRAGLNLTGRFNIQAFYVGERSGDYIIVPAESRIFDVAYETRTVQVDNEIRKMLVNKENRQGLVASETRTLIV
jgi:hypothetical protein